MSVIGQTKTGLNVGRVNIIDIQWEITKNY